MVTRAGSASGGWARGEGAGAPWTRGAPRWASTSASTVRARSCRVWRKARQAEGQPAIRAALEDHAARLAASRGALPPLLPGLQPERLGLLAGEQEILKHWLNPPGAVAEVLNGGEQELYRELLTRMGGKQIMVTPKMRVLDTLEPTRMAELTQPERDYAFRA